MTTSTASVIAAFLGAVGTVHAQCTWTAHAPYPVSGFDGAAVYHAGLQRVLFLNGADAGGVSIRAWDGAAWTLLSAGGPPNRSGMGAAYDSARERVVMFGGKTATGQYPNETWEWSVSGWTNVGVGPPGRWHHGVAYDAWRQKTVMFGGSIQGARLNQTWEWDGSTWTFMVQYGPAAREVGAFAFDTVRNRVFLYGSYMGAYPLGPLTDMWEWDGSSWVQWAGGSTSRLGGWMVADPGRGRLILGQLPYPNGVQGPYETWELDTASAGQNWTVGDPGTASVGPGAFDAARGKAVFLDLEYSPGPNYPPAITEQPFGATYHLGVSATFATVSSGTGPLTMQWSHDGQPLTNGGRISGADTSTLTINPLQLGDEGAYRMTVTNLCGTRTSYAAVLQLLPDCYANCDNSTSPPILTANDFQCFLNMFAAGNAYANCDGSCNAICLTANDFQCFLNAFATGCS